jgi:molybdate transport system substrate-binding protein
MTNAGHRRAAGPAARSVLAAAALAFTAAAAAGEILVSAAASLTDAFREIGKAFEAADAGHAVVFNFAASDILLTQIAKGAPADVVASADEATMDRADRGRLLLAGTRRDFASNRLALIVPAKGTPLARLDDVASAAVTRIALGSPQTVPAGRYAKEALEQARLWPRVAGRLVFAANVRQALDYVARGEAEAGFVYVTDAAILRDRVRIVAEVATPTPIRYPVAVVAGSREPAQARRFVDFLATPAAQQVLARHGFGPPAPP